MGIPLRPPVVIATNPGTSVGASAGLLISPPAPTPAPVAPTPVAATPAAAPAPAAPSEQNPAFGAAATSTPTALSTTLTPDQLDSLDDLVGNQTGYQPNPLNPFMNVTYKIKLYMVGDATIQAISATGISLSNMFSALDNANQVVIAQSGVTTRYNIISAELTGVGAAIVGGASNENSILLTIYEPLSASLFDAMAAAALQVGAQNMNLIPYVLEIGFTGYDQNGNALENVLANSGLVSGGRWVYLINIGSIDTEFDAGGATYKFDCKLDNTISSDDSVDLSDWPKGKNPVTMTCSGKTVKDMFKDIGDQLTKSWNEVYENVYTFKFVVHPARVGDTSDPNSFSLVPTDPHLNSIRVTQSANKLPTITIPQGTAIQDIVTSVFASAEQGQQKAKDIPKKNAIDESSTQSTTTKSRNIYIPTVRLVADYGKFDSNYMIYTKTITFHIWSQAAMIPLTKQDITDANNPDVVNATLAKFRSLGVFQKRYDYIHTGLNTEVKSFDVKFNVKWSAALPLYEGYRSTNESVSTHELYGEAKKNETTISQTSSKTSTSTPLPTTLITNPSTSIPVTSSSSATGGVSSSSTSSKSEQDPTLSTNSTSATAPTTNTVYAEDLSNPTAKIIAFQQKPATAWGSSCVGMTAPHGRDRGLMGAILERSGTGLGDSGQAMINATMTIRGDPFWMSYTNLETKTHDEGSPPPLSPTVEQANVTDSINYMLITFSYPFGFNTDGSPNFGNQGKKTNFFNGIYQPQTVTHHFEAGEFYQTLQLNQCTLLQLVDAAALSSNTTTTTGTAAAATPTPSP